MTATKPRPRRLHKDCAHLFSIFKGLVHRRQSRDKGGMMHENKGRNVLVALKFVIKPSKFRLPHVTGVGTGVKRVEE